MNPCIKIKLYELFVKSSLWKIEKCCYLPNISLPFCHVLCDFRVKTMFGSYLLPFVFLWASCFIYVICLFWYPRRFSYQVILLNTTCVTSEEGIACLSGESEFTSEFWWSSCCSIFNLLCSTVTVIICPFSFGHCIVGPSSLYGFSLPLWYLLLFSHLRYALKHGNIINLVKSLRNKIICFFSKKNK